MAKPSSSSHSPSGSKHPAAHEPALHEPANYEVALDELERLVERMESGQLPLDQLLDNYKRGAELLDFCRHRLQAVETQVKMLEDGQLKNWNPPS